jgi:leader peptidase (prepilin peptidase)/N-methyltransferase
MDLLQNHPVLWMSVAALLGLQFGSFLNVVVWRLPVMMQREWEAELASASGQSSTAPVFNLSTPSSHCTSCMTPLRTRDLVPVLSYLWLKGRCGHCGAHVSIRYPLVELTVAAMWAFCASHWGLSIEALVWAGFATLLLALALIDADTMLLPDALTQPLLWVGLVVSALGLTQVNLYDSFWGAVVGYGFLWLVQAVFGLITGKQGMGEGDFKLLAALGAWLGWFALPGVVLMSSLLAVLVAIVMRLRGSLASGQAFPFGPYLAVAGLLTAAFEPMAMFTQPFIR